MQLEENLAATLTALEGGLSSVNAQAGRVIFVLENSRDDLHSASIRRALQRHPEMDATVIRLPDSGPNGGRRRTPAMSALRSSWTARRALGVHLQFERAAAVYIHADSAALLAARVMAAIPTVISLDATLRNRGLWRHWNPLVVPADFLNRRAYGLARALVTSSHWAADSLIRDYRVQPEKVHVLRPGVDLSVFRPTDGAREPGPIRVLFVGADFLQTGGLDLLAAMGRLGERAELDIVCASPVGPLQAGLRWRHHPRLHPQSPEIAQLYRRADIFALPSTSESPGTQIAQAMACGLPVVGCPTGAISELVIDGLNGFLVPPSDPLRLGRVIEVLIDNIELRQAMGRKSLELAQQEHDAARNNDSLFALLRSVTRTAHA